MDVSDYFTDGKIDVTVSLTHPFAGIDQYHGFDVGGVFMHNGNANVGYDGLTNPEDPDGTDNVAVLDNPKLQVVLKQGVSQG
ncbi:MAG TPA: hypothetical protein VGB30_09670 [bacterium]|jgi:hypothetical protein